VGLRALSLEIDDDVDEPGTEGTAVLVFLLVVLHRAAPCCEGVDVRWLADERQLA
jgi:hypothetical protein